jgi:FlaG/FlaF family flagellin (archaellin)
LISPKQEQAIVLWLILNPNIFRITIFFTISFYTITGLFLNHTEIKKGMQMKQIKRHIRRNVKAISPVLAVLMMIAVAIAGSLVVYAWVMGYIGLSTERSGQAIMIQSIANDATDTDLVVFVQNIGEGSVQLEGSSCLYVNGEIVDCTITGVTVSDGLATLNKGDTATLTYVEGAALPGEKVTVKVTTLLGTSAEAHEYPAGSARATPAFHHFAFSTIASPQVSGVAFTITITALDQYGEMFDYMSTCDLVYSDGTIAPLVTGAFNHGEWTGDVTVTGSADAATITATGTIQTEYTGTSNTFEVDAPVMFVSAGTGGKDITVGSPTINIPPTYPPDLEAGDLILLQIGIRDTSSIPNTPSGFTQLYGPDYAGSGRQWIYYKFSDGTETGPLPISVSGSYESVISIMYAFRYVAQPPNTFAENPSITADDATTITAPTVTTSPRGLALAFIYAMDNQEIGDFDGETGGDWTVLGNVPGEASMSDSDAIIVAQFAEMFDGGTISGGDVGRVGVRDENWVVRAFALIPRD